jgi:hypothetical protein
MSALFKKLLIIQKHINGLGKDKSTNSYRYVTGDKVLEHIKPIMNEQGIILKQEILSIENTRQDYKVGVTDQKPDGRLKSEINSKVMMKFTWVDSETGEKDENLFGANGQNDWDKGVGSALTYGERYFLLKYFHIATDEDDIDNPERKKEESEALKVLEGYRTNISLCTNLKQLETLYKSLPKETQVTLKKDVSEKKTELEKLELHHAEEMKKRQA